MFKIFISASSLERICLDEMDKDQKQQSSWFLILCKQNIIYLDKDIWSEWFAKGDDYMSEPLYLFSSSNGVEFRTSASNFNTNYEKEPDIFLKEPQAAYLLDVDKETALSLQEKYGVLCQSTQNLSDCMIDVEEKKIPLYPSRKNHTWADVFSHVKKIPVNALVIVDRYIFSYENTYRSNCFDGLKNVKDILKNALPENLSRDFHVLIIFDNESIDNEFNLIKFANALEFFKKNELKRPYNIIIELYSISNKCFNYEQTHNRKIISNYYMAYADHMIKAFAQTGKPICRQNIRIESAFSHGLHDDLADTTMFEIQEDLKELASLHQEALKEVLRKTELAEEYDAICGIDESSDVPDIKNRLILI
jgi:hypothetical protein